MTSAVPPERMLGGIGEGLSSRRTGLSRRDSRSRPTVSARQRALPGSPRRTRRSASSSAGPIREFQAIEFMIADMAVDIMAAKSTLYRVAWEIDAGIDRKSVHARASAVKLLSSEMAGRVLDKAVQVLGGRGYMRASPVERLYRDVRVDRIWEGTSEIQRTIIGAQVR